MKNKTDEVKYCKSKDCKKVLSVGYKYKYCEACRNKHVEKIKKILKVVGGTVASVAVVVLTVRKNNPKNK